MIHESHIQRVRILHATMLFVLIQNTSQQDFVVQVNVADAVMIVLSSGKDYFEAFDLMYMYVSEFMNKY